MLGGGAARGAAQVGALLAMFEAGMAPPDQLIGVSVGALNAATIAAYPSVAGAGMLRELWLSKPARDVFRLNPIDLVLSRLRGGLMTPLPATNVTRVIERHLNLTGIALFEQLKVPLAVVATEVATGRPTVFRRGRLLPALQASTAIPAVFPAVDVDGTWYLDGGVADNMPISLAVEEGAREVLGIALTAAPALERLPRNWTEVVARTVQIALHQRLLSDFERVRRKAKLIVLCPLLGPHEGMDMRPDRLLDVIERTRLATLRLLQQQGRRLFHRSAIHHLDLESQESHSLA